jgi:hypothetical protein
LQGHEGRQAQLIQRCSRQHRHGPDDTQALRLSDALETAAMDGIDPGSDGLARCRRVGVSTTHAVCTA